MFKKGWFIIGLLAIFILAIAFVVVVWWAFQPSAAQGPFELRIQSEFVIPCSTPCEGGTAYIRGQNDLVTLQIKGVQ